MRRETDPRGLGLVALTGSAADLAARRPLLLKAAARARMGGHARQGGGAQKTWFGGVLQ